jgi:hypothetical protein
VNQQLQNDIRAYLSRHSGEAVRPVPLAQRLGVRDIRVMRAALKSMADSGELVSCLVIKDEVQDHEYRLSTGVPTAQHYRSFSISPPGPRRADSSAVPSRMTDLPVSERAPVNAKPGVTYAADPTHDAPPGPARPRRPQAMPPPARTTRAAGSANAPGRRSSSPSRASRATPSALPRRSLRRRPPPSNVKRRGIAASGAAAYRRAWRR